jgi:hypothetical protein
LFARRFGNAACAELPLSMQIDHHQDHSEDSMRRRRDRKPRIAGPVLVALVVVAGFAACDRSTDPSLHSARAPTNARPTVARVVGSKYRRPSEDVFVAIGQDAPTFAGVFRDHASGDLIAYVADSGQFGLVRASLARHIDLGDVGLPKGVRPPIVIRRADYTFQQLSDWRDVVTDSLLGTLGVVFDDLEETTNRVLIGAPNGQQGQILSRLTALGVPVTAIRFEAMSALHLNVRRTRMMSVANIGYIADSLTGGFYIGSVTGGCTLGFVTQPQSGVSYAITASHCTPSYWGLDTATFVQPRFQSSNPIGQESLDPPGVGCTPWYVCNSWRYSDATRITLNSSAASSAKAGFLPRLAGRSTGGASTTNIATNPWLTIAGTFPPLSGQAIEHIGFATGWTCPASVEM